ncbi:hypothetical protein [uncultured Shewanella sp.]|uniref:hypothetical protein n=1 Tax=uncultured Shewanella sp. TaxID=173975 RepID=UPI00261F7969|nr:hypothetical protein [uncultured Shewanella sp.]
MKASLTLSVRCLAAVVGGYCVACLSSLALVPVQRALFNYPVEDAILIATMFSYLVFFAVIIDCFCQDSAFKAWRNILVYSVIFIGICGFCGGIV